MTVSSAHEVAAAEPVIRRVVAARAANPADIDDLVQDCLERLLAARGRLAPEAVLPYAIVTARNLVSTHARNAARRATAAPRILDPSQPDRPEDVLLAGEARDAMLAALGQLSPGERGDLLAYYRDDPLVGGTPGPAGAVRVRMSRTRAKLRLEYLLAFRHIELPSPVCRRVLLAISAGDTRRQRELSAGEHLLDCQTCAALSEPLGRRSIALTAITVPGVLAARGLAKAQAHPVHAASVTAGSAAVVAAAVLAPKMLAGPPAPLPAKPPAAVISRLAIGGRPVPVTEAQRSMNAMIGQRVDASGVNVVAAVTRNGFWIGTPRARIWVQLVGPLKPLRIRPGDHLRFTGTVVANSPSYPAQAGVTSSGGASLLERQGAHLAVSTTSIGAATAQPATP
jgi:RNA polymerase sigma factor (sigma-70 family)